ncbi:ribosomal protein L22/L17 [Lipomyces kononenkoae]|uniref:Ribosomal protein L22/L17 n=1 Tax=Lipomyces kononenkoae TaxID=34357 RepID=A0ACC3SX96_LIPKO
MSRTEEDRERDQLNEALDRYDADTETEKLVDRVDEQGQKAIKKPEDDDELLARIRPAPKTVLDHYLGPLRKAVYLKQTTGAEDLLIVGKKYKLKLSKKEKELLEPSVWLKSNTQRGSIKKVTPLLRSLRRMNIHQAIAHCHFNTKAIARDVEKLLYRGIEEAKALGIPETGLYIDQIWSGKEPKAKAVVPVLRDIKGRGRMGTMKRKEHHVQVILKTPVTKARIAKEKEAKMINKKPWIPVSNKPIYDKTGAHYTW